MELKEVLSLFGIDSANNIEQVYGSAWNVDDKYILKKNADKQQFEKSIKLSDLLLNENIPVPEYIRTPDGRTYIQANDTNYCLMKKISGWHLDAFEGNAYKNGIMLGIAVANLHSALVKICENFDVYEDDCMKELDGWITDEIRAKNIEIPQEIIDYCYSFKPICDTLPRQLIHRDVHLNNMIFDETGFKGYIDFDISQKNIRLLDICYLGSSLLVENYKDSDKLNIWYDIFRGILYGYGRVLKLTENEITAIPYTFVFIEVLFSAFFARTSQKDLSDSCVDMAIWMYSHKSDIVRIANIAPQ